MPSRDLRVVPDVPSPPLSSFAGVVDAVLAAIKTLAKASNQQQQQTKLKSETKEREEKKRDGDQQPQANAQAQPASAASLSFVLAQDISLRLLALLQRHIEQLDLQSISSASEAHVANMRKSLDAVRDVAPSLLAMCQRFRSQCILSEPNQLTRAAALYCQALQEHKAFHSFDRLQISALEPPPSLRALMKEGSDTEALPQAAAAATAPVDTQPKPPDKPAILASLESIGAMGFSEEEAKWALIANRGDLMRATDAILQGNVQPGRQSWDEFLVARGWAEAVRRWHEYQQVQSLQETQRRLAQAAQRQAASSATSAAASSQPASSAAPSSSSAPAQPTTAVAPPAAPAPQAPPQQLAPAQPSAAPVSSPQIASLFNFAPSRAGIDQPPRESDEAQIQAALAESLRLNQGVAPLSAEDARMLTALAESVRLGQPAVVQPVAVSVSAPATAASTATTTAPASTSSTSTTTAASAATSTTPSQPAESTATAAAAIPEAPPLSTEAKAEKDGKTAEAKAAAPAPSPYQYSHVYAGGRSDPLLQNMRAQTKAFLAKTKLGTPPGRGAAAVLAALEVNSPTDVLGMSVCIRSSSSAVYLPIALSGAVGTVVRIYEKKDEPEKDQDREKEKEKDKDKESKDKDKEKEAQAQSKAMPALALVHFPCSSGRQGKIVQPEAQNPKPSTAPAPAPPPPAAEPEQEEDGDAPPIAPAAAATSTSTQSSQSSGSVTIASASGPSPAYFVWLPLSDIARADRNVVTPFGLGCRESADALVSMALSSQRELLGHQAASLLNAIVSRDLQRALSDKGEETVSTQGLGLEAKDKKEGKEREVKVQPGKQQQPKQLVRRSSSSSQAPISFDHLIFSPSHLPAALPHSMLASLSLSNLAQFLPMLSGLIVPASTHAQRDYTIEHLFDPSMRRAVCEVVSSLFFASNRGPASSPPSFSLSVSPFAVTTSTAAPLAVWQRRTDELGRLVDNIGQGLMEFASAPITQWLELANGDSVGVLDEKTATAAHPRQQLLWIGFQEPASHDGSTVALFSDATHTRRVYKLDASDLKGHNQRPALVLNSPLFASFTGPRPPVAAGAAAPPPVSVLLSQLIHAAPLCCLPLIQASFVVDLLQRMLCCHLAQSPADSLSADRRADLMQVARRLFECLLSFAEQCLTRDPSLALLASPIKGTTLQLLTQLVLVFLSSAVESLSAVPDADLGDSKNALQLPEVFVTWSSRVVSTWATVRSRVQAEVMHRVAAEARIGEQPSLYYRQLTAFLVASSLFEHAIRRPEQKQPAEAEDSKATGTDGKDLKELLEVTAMASMLRSALQRLCAQRVPATDAPLSVDAAATAMPRAEQEKAEKERKEKQDKKDKEDGDALFGFNLADNSIWASFFAPLVDNSAVSSPTAAARVFSSPPSTPTAAAKSPRGSAEVKSPPAAAFDTQTPPQSQSDGLPPFLPHVPSLAASGVSPSALLLPSLRARMKRFDAILEQSAVKGSSARDIPSVRIDTGNRFVQAGSGSGTGQVAAAGQPQAQPPAQPRGPAQAPAAAAVAVPQPIVPVPADAASAPAAAPAVPVQPSTNALANALALPGLSKQPSGGATAALAKVNILHQLTAQLKKVSPLGLRGPLGEFSWKTTFVGVGDEGGAGFPGPYRESIARLAANMRLQALDDRRHSPFILCPNGVNETGENRDRLLLNPSPILLTRAYVPVLRTVGLVLGCVLRSSTCLALEIASFFWKPLRHGSAALCELIDTDFGAALDELKQIDLATAQMLLFQDTGGRPYDESTFNQLHENLVYTAILSSGQEIELFPGGRNHRVLFADRFRYARMVLRARFQESDAHMAILRSGLESVVPFHQRSFSLLTWQELEVRICGSADVDLELLKKHTVYRETEATSEHVQNFWSVLQGFSQHDRGRFLQFAWARSRLLYDMSGTQMVVRFVADKKDSAKTDLMLPKSQTCFFQVDIPKYSTLALMKERLALAICCVDINF